MIRSSKATLKFVNRGKLTSLREFIGEYRRVATLFIDLLWDEKDIPSLLPKEITGKITDSWLSARALQAAGKQASGIVRGTKEKQAKRLFINLYFKNTKKLFFDLNSDIIEIFPRMKAKNAKA